MKKISLAILLLMCSLLFGISFGQNKVNAKTQEWSVLKTTHFDLYYPKGEDQFGKTAALMAEEIYYYIKADLKYPIFSRIPLVLYSTKTEFQTTNIIYPLLSEGVGGFTESLRNRVAIPFDGSYSNLEKLIAHELTHAYINALDARVTDAMQSLRPKSFPFWFSEGLPEFLSIGGTDNYNNMFVLDMVINDSMQKLDFIDGYYAYRLGESFLTFIADVYGRDKVNEFFYSLRTAGNLEDSTKRVFGMKFDELESRWKFQLKREYFPAVQSHQNPQEAFERRTDHKKDGSYFNFSPRFSPDGSRYVYFGDSGARYSIWQAGTQGFAKPKKVITGETSAKLEEFYYFRSSLSWFPDNQRIAFSAKTSNGDRIHILNVDKGKIEKTIRIPELEAIFEVDVSPDGGQILMSAQSGMQTDIFLYGIADNSLRRLTNDSYYDAQPRFSPDGKSLVFTSERDPSSKEKRYGYFTNLTTDIFQFNLENEETVQLTKEDFNCSQAMYSGDGSKVIFLSERNKISNYEVIDLQTNTIARMNAVLSGIANGDISRDGNYLIVSNFWDGAWNLYFDQKPLTNLNYESYSSPTLYVKNQDLLDLIDYSVLDNYGTRKKEKIKRVNPARNQDTRRPVFSTIEPVLPDSLLISESYSFDDKPETKSENPPTIQNYRPKFGLDTLWGGMAYSSSSGAFGSIEMGFSDLMGDHAIGMNLGISEHLKETNALLTYLQLKHRIDWGIGVYNFYDEAYYRQLSSAGYDYWRLKERQTGLYGMIRYPFSRFMRVELNGMLYEYKQQWDFLPNANIDSDTWINNVDQLRDTAITPQINLVYDNALYGSTGPMSGWRSSYSIRRSFSQSKQDFITQYLDFRSYLLFERRYSLAFRVNAGISLGDYPDRFNLAGYYGVRALDTNISGEKKVLSSVELRVPFLETLSLAFPVPITLSHIRGSVFVDAGAVWDEEKLFRGMRDDKLEDIKFGYGFGPRMNLGYFVLKMDAAWLTDLSKISKPQVFISLSEDF